MNPPSVLAPLASIWLRFQYTPGAARNSPVTTNDTSCLVTRSRSRNTWPVDTCSRAAAEVGSAAGIGPLGAGTVGQAPVTRCAWEVTSLKVAASVIGMFFPPVMGSPSGSDQ